MTFFWPWSSSLRLLITILLIVNRFDWEDYLKIKLEELLFWGISSKPFPLFSLVWFFFSFSFFCLFYVLICLYSLVLGSLCAFKHVRLLVSPFLNSTMFRYLLCFWARVSEQTYACMHSACTCRSKYAYACSWPVHIGLYMCAHTVA